MYLLRPDTKIKFSRADILVEAPLDNGLYRANFAEVVSRIGKVKTEK
jgi:hypothetical protein